MSIFEKYGAFVLHKRTKKIYWYLWKEQSINYSNLRAFITDHIIAKGTCMAHSIITSSMLFIPLLKMSIFPFLFPVNIFLIFFNNQTIIIFFWINTSLFSLCYVFIRILAIIWLHNIKDFLIDRKAQDRLEIS